MGEAPTKIYVTTDAVTFGLSAEGELRVALIRRRNEPYQGCWCLPGGFVDEHEDLPDACARELFEETGLAAAAMFQIGAWGKPGRDPRGRNVTVAYGCAVHPDEQDAVAGDDAADAAWYPVDDLPPLGFDHADILAAGLRELRRLARCTHVAFAFLGDRFTLHEVGEVMVALLGREDGAAEVPGLLDAGSVEPAGDMYRCTADEFLAPLG